MNSAPATGLIVVDVQNDFCEGGSLAVEGGARVAAGITELLASSRPRYAMVVASRDWHIDPGGHFADTPDFVDSWPRHCVAGTQGAAFHPGLDLGQIDEVVSKGERAAAYSAFEGVDSRGRTLASLLGEAGVSQVDVVGLATDYCVRATALDARRLGLGVRLLTDLCAGVAPESTARSLEEMAEAGVELV